MSHSQFNDKSTPIVPRLTTATAVSPSYWRPSSSSNHDTEGEKPIKHARSLPSYVPLLGNSLELKQNAERMHDWISDQFVAHDGEPFVVRLPGKNDMMFIAKPEHLEQVLKTQFDVFPKSVYIHDMLCDWLGDGIVITNGEVWKRQRRALVSLFSARALREHMAPIVHKYADQLVEILGDAAASKSSLDVFSLLHRYTFDVFGEIGFGTEMRSMAEENFQPLSDAMDEAQTLAGMRFKQPMTLWKLKRWLNVGSERRLREAVQTMDGYVMRIISDAMERRRLRVEKEKKGKISPSPDIDIVSILLDSMDANNELIDPMEIRDVAIAAIVAGASTTADTLGWLFHLLSQNPRVETKLRSQLLTQLPKLTTDRLYVPSMEEVNEIPYLEATIKEVLRLYPAAPLVSTRCIQDTAFPDGTFVPRDTDVGLSLFSTGRLPSVWGSDAADFKPERFLDPETGKVIAFAATKHCAFSAGPRVCVGQTLALVEMKTVVACVLSHFHMVPKPGQHVAYTQGIALGMQNPLMMKIKSVDKQGVRTVA